MQNIYYQPEGYAFGDCMPFYKDGKFYLYHQRDTRNPGPFGEPFGWALAITEDFVHYEDKGEVLLRGKDIEQDQFIFAGSVFEGEGQYHAFYTGYNRDFAAEGKAAQVLMHATSDDLLHWTKSADKLKLPPQIGYDPNDWRDPYVTWDEESKEYILILGAHKQNHKQIKTGCTVYFTSKDLEHWEFKGDFWAPNMFSMHEMPDLFRIGDWWYLLTTEYSENNKTIYRKSRSIFGPWQMPDDDAFDGRAYYAARSCGDSEHRYLFGWVASKDQDMDINNWIWGGTLVVHELVQEENGDLKVKMPDSVHNAFVEQPSKNHFGEKVIEIDSGINEVIIEECDEETFLFETVVSFKAGTHAFGVNLFEEKETGDAYRFNIEIKNRKVDFNCTPNLPWFRYMAQGSDRPLFLEADREYLLQVVVDGTVVTLYLNNTALNVRAYAPKGKNISFYVKDGSAIIKNPRLYLLKK